MSKKLSQFPESKELVKSPYTLDYIRTRFSGAIETGFADNIAHGGFIPIIYTLANEINELKSEIVELKSKLNK